jgi:hypothetical protein
MKKKRERGRERRYSVFQGFSKAKSANGGSILSSSQFLILPQLPQKIKLASKVVKVDLKIIISIPKILIPETHGRKRNRMRESDVRPKCFDSHVYWEDFVFCRFTTETFNIIFVRNGDNAINENLYITRL